MPSTQNRLSLRPDVQLRVSPDMTGPVASDELALITRDLAGRAGADTGMLTLRDFALPARRIGHGYENLEEDLDESAIHSESFVGRIIATGHTVGELISPDDQSLGLAASGVPLRYAVGAAVRPPGGPQGALCIAFSVLPSHEQRRLAVWMAERYAGLAALCLKDTGVLEGLLSGVRLDGLTGCLNHAAIRSELHREVKRSARNGRPLSCCFIDLDRFKHLNDTYGHPHGSQVLADVAAILHDSVRVGDTIGRYGGDEFIAVLPDTNRTDALLLAERLRSAISSTPLRRAHERLGASVGVAQAQPDWSADDLLAAADDALLAAKSAGGGRVIGADTGTTGAPPNAHSPA